MKNLLLLIALFFVFNLFGQEIMYPEGLPFPDLTELKKSSKNDFFPYYLEAKNLNKDRFKNLDSIRVGDTILLPSLNGEIKKVIAQEPFAGIHDCLWRASKKEFLEINIAKEPDTIKTLELNKTDSLLINKEITKNTKHSQGNIDYLLIIGTLIIGIFLVNIIIYVFIPYFYKKNRHFLKFPVFVQDFRMLSDEDKLKLLKNYLTKDEKINYIEYGSLGKHFGNRFLKVKLQFKDKKRFAFLSEGDLICKVIIDKGNGNFRSEFFTTQGGLRFISPENEMTIPANWYFKPDFPKKDNESNSSINLIDTLTSIDNKRNNILKKGRKNKKKKSKQLSFEELDKIIEVIRNCRHLKYDIDYHDNYGDWYLKLTVKPKNKKNKKKNK